MSTTCVPQPGSSLSISSSSKQSTTFTINFDNSSSSTQNDFIRKTSSLQESFKNYRDYKLDGIKLNENNKLLRKSYRSNPDRMWNLRLKFVEQAKKYFDVPYAKKYFSPESPEYHSKLFLDCCGLVRRIMRDLEQDFGFRIGGGNQAYMFDTLPKTIEKLEDVKPGDLVFIKAVYYNPKMKKQPHNITHVEIMLGEGEKTIGARWNNGKVQVFDSYKFISKSYHSQEYFFKSIDHWLLGLCRSYCSKHSWKYNTVLRSKKSIFSLHDSSKIKKSNSIKDLSENKKLKKKKKKKKRSKSKPRKEPNSIVKENLVKELEKNLNSRVIVEESSGEQSDDESESEDQQEDLEEPAEEEDEKIQFLDDFSIKTTLNQIKQEKRPFTCVERRIKALDINN